MTKTGLMFLSQSSKTEFENKIRESAEFDKIACSQRESIIRQKKENSSSISKISNAGKIVKVGALGILGAGDLGKTWKCESCGCKS